MTQKDLNELKIAAENGDVNAAIRVGDYYREMPKKDASEILNHFEEACVWYEKASRKGNVDAWFRWSVVKNYFIGFDLDKGLFDSDEIDDLEKGLSYCDEVLEKYEHDGFFTLRNKLLIKVSLAYSHENNLDKAIECAERAISNGSEGGKILKSVHYMDRFSENNCDEDINASFAMIEDLPSLMADDLKMQQIKEEFGMNNMYSKIMIRALYLLSICYRYGGTPTSVNIPKSYDMLRLILDTDWPGDAESEINLAQDDIQHYKKGLFGGMKYID